MEWWKAIGICAAFFLALSPGFLLTLPPVSGSTKGLFSKGLFHSLETSNTSIFTHTVVFLVLVGGLLWYLDSGSGGSGGSGSGSGPAPTVDDSSAEGDDTDSAADADSAGK
jgi:hypothetical protein